MSCVADHDDDDDDDNDDGQSSMTLPACGLRYRPVFPDELL